MKRKLVIAILGLLAVLAVLLAVVLVMVHTGSFRGFLETRLTSALTGAAGRPVTLQIRDLSPLRLRATVEGFTIEGASPDGPPLVTVARIDLGANWSAVFRRRVDLSSLKLTGLRVDLEQLPPEWLEADPDKPPLSLKAILDQLAIDRLEVNNGWLHFARADLPLDIRAEDVALSADFHRLGGRYDGELSVGAGRLAIPEQGDFPLHLQASFGFDAKAVTLTDLQLESTGLTLNGSGELTDPALPVFEASFEAAVTPGALPLTALADLQFDGDVALNGTVEGRGADIRVAAVLNSPILEAASVAGRDISCELVLEEDQLRITDLAGVVLGANVEGELAAALSGLAPYSAELRFRSDDPDPFLDWLLPESRPGNGGSYSGRLDLTGTAYDLESLDGRFDLVADSVALVAAPDGVLDAEVAARIVDGELVIDKALVETAGIEMDAAGVVGKAGASDLSLKVAVPSLQHGLPFCRQLLSALGLPAEHLDLFSPLSGNLSLEARLDGPWSGVDGSAELAVDQLAFDGRSLGRLDATATASGGLVETSGTLSGMGGGIGISGGVDLGRDGFPGAVELLLHDQPMEPYLAFTDLDMPLGGAVNGRATVNWPDPRLQADLALVEGEVSGISVEVPVCELLLAPGRLELTRARLQAAGGTLEISGVLGEGEEPGGLTFEGGGFRVESLVEQLGAPPGPAGRFDIEGTVTGDPGDPRLAARVKLWSMTVAEWSAPELEGDLSLSAGGFETQLASPDGGSVAAVSLGFGEGETWAAEISYPLHLDSSYWLEGDGAGVVADGLLRSTLSMTGPDPATLQGMASVENLRIDSAGEASLVAQGPLEIRIAGGKVEIQPVRLTGEHTTLDIAGSLGLEEPWNASLTVRGAADLLLLRGFSERLRSEGIAELDLSFDGPLDVLETRGELRLRNGLLGHPGFPLLLRKAEADVTLQPGRWTLDRLEVTAGGGTITGSGELVLDGLAIESHRIELTGRGVRMAYPEGLRSEMDSDLLLVRERGGTGRLSGEIRVISGLYDEDISVEPQLLARTRAEDRIARVERGLLDRVGLDLRVRADDGLWVRNNLASMETRVALRVQGSIGAPDISGRVEALEGGRVSFRGVDYGIVRGSIDYPGGPSSEPAVDIRAETAKSDYDIRLAITGPLENLEFELSSSPPLSQTDIVTLLVTGKTRDEMGSSGGGISDDEATVYLSGALTQNLAPTLKRSLGLDEVTVNPVLMGSQADPTARITVGKTLTPRLFFTYSSLMGSDRQDVYQARYRFTDRLNVLGTRDEDGSLSGDVVYRSRIYRGPPGGGGESGAGGRDARKISRIRFRGNTYARSFTLRRQLGVATLDRYHRSRLLAGLERIRDWYYARGFPEIEVEHQVIEKEKTVDLEITVDEGNRVLISTPGFPWPKRPLRRELYRLWTRSVFREDLLEEGARLVTDELSGRGFVRATVEPVRSEPKPGREEVVFRVDRGKRVKVEEVRFEGLQEVEEKEVRLRMLTREPSLLGREGFSPDTLDEDVGAIRNYYATKGFLDAEVGSRVDYLPDDPDRVTVTVEIEEGARYRLGPVTFEGNEAYTSDELIAGTELRIGSPFNDEAVRDAERKLAAFYDGRGYSNAGIRSELRIDRDDAVVDVDFQVEEGPKLVVEEVEVVSPGITSPEVIRRELELWAGQPLSTSKAGRSQYNLYRTGLFRSVGYEILPGETPEGRRVVFTLEESPNVQFDYGLGYNSDFGIRVSANVAHTNVFGRGLYVGFGGRYSGDDSRAQFITRKPRLWGSEIEGLVRGYWEQEDRVNYDATRLGGVLQGTRRYRDGRYTLIWGYGLEDVTSSQKGLADRPGMPFDDPYLDPRLETETRLGSLRLDGARDTRDAFLWPTAGSYLRAELGIYDSALLSEAEYLRGFFHWNYYQTLFRSAIWVSSVRLGLAEPYGDTEYLPISERFFTGGESSLRGFKYDTLNAVGAPVLPGMESGISTGGNALFLFNQELALPLADPAHLLFFYDAGNLYWQADDLDLTDLRHSAGLGLRIRTPVGPLRLEYGWKLDREEGESPGRFHFSFGMPF